MRRRAAGWHKTVIGCVIVAVMLFPVYWMVLTSARTEADSARTPPLLLPTHLLPGIAVATPLFILFKRLALLNSYLGIILADATITVPFAILVMRPFFLRIPRDLESAALVDGCRPLGAFIRIVLPISRSGIVTVAALAFLLSWGEFLFALSLTTTNDIEPLTVALATFSSSTGTPWNQVMAVATLGGGAVVGAFVVLPRHIVG